MVTLQCAQALADYGIEPRHLRAFRSAADRQSDLIAQIAGPVVKAGKAGARDRADDLAREVAALAITLHTSLIKSAVRDVLRPLRTRLGARRSDLVVGRRPSCRAQCGGQTQMGEVRVVGIRVEQPQNQPVLLLRGANGDRYLPIWIGQSEAAAIALEQQGVEPARPLTHDLIRDLIAALGHSLKEVRIIDLQEGTFYADLIFDSDIKVSAPAVGLGGDRAARRRAHLRRGGGARRGGLLIPDESDEEAAGAVREDEVEKFKEFLDSVSPDDFKAT